jgi:hypothetical protein
MRRSTRGAPRPAVLAALLVTLAGFTALGPAGPAAAATPGTSLIADPSGANLEDVGNLSCPTTAFCVGAGGTGAAPLVEVDQGGAWTPQVLPAPAGATNATLADVSCPTTTWCLAVGYWSQGNGNQQFPLAEQYDGTGWSIVTGTEPSGPMFTPSVALAVFYGVSCAAPGRCTAVGTWGPGGNTLQLLVSTLSNGSWTATTASNLAGEAYAALDAVSCPTATSCVAVGYSETPQPRPIQSPLAAVPSGPAWVAVPVSTLAGYNAGALAGISCPSAGVCMAVGAAEQANSTGGGTYVAMADSSDQTGWHVSPTPSLGGVNSGLSAVSCTSSTFCEAAGYLLPYTDETEGVAETFSGTGWTAQTGIVPAETTQEPAVLQSVACAGAGPCQYLGFDVDPSFTKYHAFSYAPPVQFTSPTAGTLAERTAGSLPLSAVATTPVTLVEVGKLPSGVHFTPTKTSGNGGAATLAGTPAAFSAGTYPVSIQATDQNGDQLDETYQLTVSPAGGSEAPTVTGVTPSDGPGGGGRVTVTGTNLSHVEQVDFGGQPATSVAPAPGGLQVTPPPGSGTVDVVVTTNEGSSPVVPADQYTYDLPAVTSLSVTSGTGSGGTKVVVKGTDFQGIQTVWVGGQEASLQTVNGPGTAATILTPSSAAGPEDVTVETVAGFSPTTPADVFTYLVPTVTSVSPATGSAGGGDTVVVHGAGLASPYEVDVGATPASVVTWNAAGTSLTVTAPAGTGTVDVTVDTGAGTSAVSPADHYTYGVPVVTSVSPSSGAPGDTVVVHGKYLGGATAVTFGGAAAGVTLVTATAVTVTVPAGTGLVHVAVTTAAGTSNAGTNASRFTYS